MTEQLKIPSEIGQQISLLNMRIGSVNLSLTDLIREIDSTLKAMALKIAELEKENSGLNKPANSKP